MKKGMLLFIIAGATLILTGCNNKSTLNCTTTDENVERNFKISFVGNKIDAISLDYSVDLSKYSDSQIEAFNNQDLCSELKSEVEEFKDSFSDCSQKLENKKINISSNFDVNKMTGDQLSKMQTPEDAKKDLENTGYKCTIEK